MHEKRKSSLFPHPPRCSSSSSTASKTFTTFASSMSVAASMTSPDGVVSMMRMSRGSAVVVVTVFAANWNREKCVYGTNSGEGQCHSVTRCSNKQCTNFFPKVAQEFLLRRCTFSKQPKKLLPVLEKLITIIFKNSLTWSHWTQWYRSCSSFWRPQFNAA